MRTKPSAERSHPRALALALPCPAAAVSAAFALTAILWLVASAAHAADWPQFRGPQGDGRAEAAKLQLPWPENGPTLLWDAPLGGGYSGISAMGDTLYTLMSSGSDEFLVALDLDTGEERWRLRTDDKRRDQFGDGPRSTPTLDGDRVYTVSALGRLWCVDRHTGEVRWSRDLRKEFGAVVPTWGVSASPVVHGDLLLFNVGGRADHSLMAFHKLTGEVRWHSTSGMPGYSLPIIRNLAGVEQSIFFTGTQLISVDPESGEPYWQRPWKTAYDVNAAAPVHVPPDRLFISSGYDTGAALFRIARHDGELSVEELWRTRSMKNQFSSSVYHDGYIYGFDNDHFKCIDVGDGQDRWQKTGFGHGSLLYADGHLVVLSDSGRLAVVAADPERYSEKADAQVARGKHWTPPSLHRGRLLVRNQRSLMAFQLGPPSMEAAPETTGTAQ